MKTTEEDYDDDEITNRESRIANCAFVYVCVYVCVVLAKAKARAEGKQEQGGILSYPSPVT